MRTMLAQDGRAVVDALTTSVTFTPLAQQSDRASVPAHVQAAAAAAYAAKLPQLTTLRMCSFVGDALGEWLAGPFGTGAGLSRVTHL